MREINRRRDRLRNANAVAAIVVLKQDEGETEVKMKPVLKRKHGGNATVVPKRSEGEKEVKM